MKYIVVVCILKSLALLQWHNVLCPWFYLHCFFGPYHLRICKDCPCHTNQSSRKSKSTRYTETSLPGGGGVAPPIILSSKSWSKWLNSWSLQSLEQDTFHVQQNLKLSKFGQIIRTPPPPPPQC